MIWLDAAKGIAGILDHDGVDGAAGKVIIDASMVFPGGESA